MPVLSLRVEPGFTNSRGAHFLHLRYDIYDKECAEFADEIRLWAKENEIEINIDTLLSNLSQRDFHVFETQKYKHQRLELYTKKYVEAGVPVLLPDGSPAHLDRPLFAGDLVSAEITVYYEDDNCYALLNKLFIRTDDLKMYPPLAWLPDDYDNAEAQFRQTWGEEEFEATFGDGEFFRTEYYTDDED
jgi:hypothetical protein